MKWTPRTLWSSGYSPALSYSCLLGYLMTGACSASSKSSPDAGGGAPLTGLQKLNHVVVVVLENWSYDSLYGEFSARKGLRMPRTLRLRSMVQELPT
jgi:phospholipase C